MGISGRGARNRSTHLRHPCTVSHAEESGRGGVRSVGSAREPGSMAPSDSRREVRAWHGIPRLEAGREAPGLTRDDRPDPSRGRREAGTPLIDDLVAEQHALGCWRSLMRRARACPTRTGSGRRQPRIPEIGVLRDGIAHLAEGDALARGVAETRRPLWPLSPSPGRPPRRGALNGRQVDARRALGRGAGRPGGRTERDRVRRALRTCAARDLLPWADRRMRARSFATSRLAACWSHGLEALEAVGPPPIVTDHIRHLAPLGYITRACADRNRGRPPPVEPLRV